MFTISLNRNAAKKKCVERKRAGSLCSGNKYHNFSYSTYAFNTQYFWLDEICFLSTFFQYKYNKEQNKMWQQLCGGIFYQCNAKERMKGTHTTHTSYTFNNSKAH